MRVAILVVAGDLTELNALLSEGYQPEQIVPGTCSSGRVWRNDTYGPFLVILTKPTEAK